MTEVGCRSDGGWGWQTLVLAAGTSLIGRWIAGSGFGYVLFAIIWGPILSGIAATDAGRSARSIWIGGAVGLLFSWPWWGVEPWPAAIRLTVLVIGLSANWAGMTAVLTRCRLPAAAVRTVSAVGWLTWVCVPLLRPDVWPDAILASFLGVNPILLANAASATAGDWTHQAIAYHQLTRLGQDVAFDWPASGLPAAILYGTTASGCIALSRFSRSRMFHVEHS